MPDFSAQVYALVRRIPPGRVVTYGWIAATLGYYRRARMVGQAMRRLPAHSNVPWHRVVNARHQISTPADLEIPSNQRELLEAEGVIFDGDTIRRGHVITDIRELSGG